MCHKPTATVTIVLAKAHIFARYKEASKTLYEILTAVTAILLPVTGSRVDRKLSRHGSVRQFLQRGGNHTWSRLPRVIVM